MADSFINTRVPQTSDNERNLLARLLWTPAPGTGLTTAARTVTTITNDIQTRGCRTLIAYLNVTAVGAAGGLRVGLINKDPISGQVRTMVQSTTLITTTGLYVFQFGPGLGTINGGSIPTAQCAVFGVALGSLVQLMVFPGSADSYTYGLTFELL